jgi:hypothetical protein
MFELKRACNLELGHKILRMRSRPAALFYDWPICRRLICDWSNLRRRSGNVSPVVYIFFSHLGHVDVGLKKE